MAEPRREPSCYFSLALRRQQSASSSPRSPMSPDVQFPTPSPVARNTISPVRTNSDYGAVHPRVKIRTIEEDVVHNASSQALVPSPRRPRIRQSSAEIRSSLAPSPRASIETNAAPKKHSHPRRSTPQADVVTHPPCKPRPGRCWSRTRSGSVWYERLKGSSGQSKDSSHRSQGSGIPLRAITPLTPPTPPAASSGPSYGHEVKVEKSFTYPPSASVGPSETHHSHVVASSASRRSSLNPFKLFSAPLQLVRKISTPRQTVSHPVRHGVHSPAFTWNHREAEMRGHKSLLKRENTSEALRLVTSILHEAAPQSGTCSPVTVINPVISHQMSDKSKSSSSVNSKKNKTTRIKTAKNPIPNMALPSRRSTQDHDEPGHSYSTSQWELKMGAQPTNTPDERATYKVKRRPSAETEEFLKVDLSVRGGTSYLPSEARRIHTPSLPQERPDGKRRGFFFDYTAPSSDTSRRVSLAKPPRLELPATISSIPLRSTSRATTVHRRTFSTRLGKDDSQLTRSKTCDWYDVKLAELDTSDDEDGTNSKERPKLGRGRSATTRSGNTLSGIKQRQEEEKFDMNIPEHLPSSPLCPRHPKYWRVVKGKGSQFRGCWMHGIGVHGEDDHADDFCWKFFEHA